MPLNQGPKKKKQIPEFYHFSISAMKVPGNTAKNLPEFITLLRPLPGDPSKDQLFIDQVPVPARLWSYDPVDRKLLWRVSFGGGHLNILQNGKGAVGVVGSGAELSSVKASCTNHFDCDIALSAGAVYTASGTVITGMSWDTASPAWTTAVWIANKLRVSYTYTPGSGMQGPETSFFFEDLQTTDTWTPFAGSYEGSIGISGQNNQIVWNLDFLSSIAPEPDGGGVPGGQGDLFPYWLQAVEDAAGAVINGAMNLNDPSKEGSIPPSGLRGVRSNPAVAGYYQTDASNWPFGIFGGSLYIGEKKIDGAFVRENTLYINNPDPAMLQKTGLPEKGVIHFSDNGEPTGLSADSGIKRLDTPSLLPALLAFKDAGPGISAASVLLTGSDPALTITTLQAMNPYTQNEAGAWYDQVQQAVTQGLQGIMNSYIPSDMWNMLFHTEQPVLTGDLATAAATAVPNVSNPAAWYQSLATAVMTQGLANGDDDNCRNMNGPRAAAWLKKQVSTSNVYYTHGQVLFKLKWQELFPLTNDFLDDQNNNAATYSPLIDQQIQLSIQDVNANVAPDPSDPDLIPDLIKELQDTGNYAKQNNLYWAMYYYVYNTSPGLMANIGIQLTMDTGSTDSSALSRLFQMNVAVLTALDPSGYFAKQYTKTLNIYLATNILPSMFGFDGDLMNYTVVRQYLEAFVSGNLNNENADIAKAANDINEFLSDKDAALMLQACIDFVTNSAEWNQMGMKLPYVANEWLANFQKNYPTWNKVGSALGIFLTVGMAGFNIYYMIQTFKKWDELSTAQQDQITESAVQFGLQALAAVITRGVRVYAVCTAEGLTIGQRAGAVSKIFATGEAGVLDDALMRIGNNTARWLGDTAGSTEAYAVFNISAEAKARIEAEIKDELEMEEDVSIDVGRQMSVTVKVFGKNLDEFVATRLGPVCILAGIGFSIYNLVEGESELDQAADGLNIAAGSLTLIGMVGGWALEAGYITGDAAIALAPIFAVAGPLALLAAAVGIGLLIYEMFETPPDPVQEFVSQYVSPAGFYVSAAASGIDYAYPYVAGDTQLLGFNLSLDPSASNKYLVCKPDGTIGLGAADGSPSVVWIADTDGVGLTEVYVKIAFNGSATPVAVCLSLMSDNSISFQPRMAAASNNNMRVNGQQERGRLESGQREIGKQGSGWQESGRREIGQAVNGTPVAVTQKWLGIPQGNASLASDGQNLAAIPLVFQPVLPDGSGNYSAAGASGYISGNSSSVGYSTVKGSTLNLSMSGIAPNYMSMKDLTFILGTKPSASEVFAPAFGIMPSAKISFALSGDPLPAFLSFDGTTGLISANGKIADTALQNNNTITGKNGLGSMAVSFKIMVEKSGK